MSNLKKILAMALALAMVMSMTAFAGFTDAAKIDESYAEAVEVLTGMEIIKGYTDGSFKPEGTITRAEVAAIIYRIATQDVEDEKAALYAGLAKFSDVSAAQWFAGYVGYCANAGYIKGYPDGTFKPQGLVTGFEALAMILRAMGYDAENEFTGITWQDKVAKAGTQAGILEELNADEKLALAADRELVAQMAFTALNDATIVRYTPAFGYTKTATTLGDAFELAAVETTDEWGRPGYGYTYNTGDEETFFAKKPTATYIEAVTECEIANDVGFSTTVEYKVWDNGFNTYKYNVQPTDTVQTLGAQGSLVEVYGKDRIVIIDTFLAKVTDVTECKYDIRGHRTAKATLTLNVYDMDNAASVVVLESTSNYTYETGDMLLVNAYTDRNGNLKDGDDEYVEIVGYADALVGAQTLLWYNNLQHTIEGTTYDDAEQFHLDQANQETTKHTWWFDQYGNLIGATDIATEYAYGIIENIQWINPVGASGYAQATIRFMDDTTETKIVKKIDGLSTAYAGYWGKGEFQDSAVAVSTNYSLNGDLCGKHLYRISTNSDGSIELKHVFTAAAAQVAEYQNHTTEATIKPGFAAIDGKELDLYVNSDTIFMVQSVSGSTISYKVVEGYENVGKYTASATVDFVDLDSDVYAEYVYIIGDTDDAAANKLFYLTSDNAQAVLSSGAISYYKVKGYVDGVYTEELKVAPEAIETLIPTAVGKTGSNVNTMFVINLTNDKVVAAAPKTYSDLDREDVIGESYKDLYLQFKAIGVAGNWNGTVLAFANDRGDFKFNVTDATIVVGELAASMTNKQVYVIFDDSVTINGAYIAKALYIVDKAETGNNGEVTPATTGSIQYVVNFYDSNKSQIEATLTYLSENLVPQAYGYELTPGYTASWILSNVGVSTTAWEVSYATPIVTVAAGQTAVVVLNVYPAQ